MTELFWLAWALTSSVTMVNIWSDHPSTTVCPDSTIRERPRRRRSTFCLSPFDSRPTSMLTMKSPPSEPANITAMYPTEPLSLATRLGVSACMRAIQSTSPAWDTPSGSLGASHSVNAVTSTIRPTETTASQPISEAVPLDMVLSNQ